MPSLYTEIDIQAPRSYVWQALIRKEQWLYWNTFLYDLDSTLPLQQGRSVVLSLRRVAGEAETEFQPVVTLVQPLVCLRWRSTVPGLQNEHVFELQDIGRGRTRYVHCDRFSGWLTRFFLPFIRQDEQRGIDRMARELKRYIERGDL
jgi:hypothetical protein